MSDYLAVKVTTDSITTALAGLAAAYDDLMPLFHDIGEEMVNSSLENFREGSGPDGTVWAPRSQTTLDAYARRKPPFVPSGGPLIGESKSLSTTISYEATGDGVLWGSNMIYAAVMQLGAKQGEFGARIGKNTKGRDFFMTIPWGDIPPRPFLGIGPDDETAILEIVEDFLADAAGV
ncbi:phage virion morphogenesis protein [Tropicibacter sp. S64]|uniref:phage virion morphogenesis protein n=1 Tax=Tropicibacter sp. S64 TaxID=3415122 RepID=UPI003C7B1991